MVISYKIYDTSLRRVSQILCETNVTSARSCLSWDFVAFKMNINIIRKRTVDMDVVNYVTCSSLSVITPVVSKVPGAYSGHPIFNMR